MSKSGLFVLLLAVCAFYSASAKPAENTVSLPSEPNRDPGRPVSLPGNVRCENGKSWKVACNTCVCNNGEVACTLMGCLDHSVHRRETSTTGTGTGPCQEGISWKVACNTCTCRNGNAACTRVACSPPPPEV